MNEIQCRALYRKVFADPDTDFEDKLFSTCFADCRAVERNGQTVSMLFALPCEITNGSCRFEARYVYAVATDPAYRKKGIASDLIRSLQKEGKPLFLIPAKPSLVSFYERLSFVPFAASSAGGVYTASPLEGFARLVQDEPCDPPADYTAMFYHAKELPPEPLFFPYAMK